MNTTQGLIVLLAAFLLATIWSSVSCNENSSEVYKLDCESQRQQLEKDYVRAFTRLVIMHLETGDEESALNEFMSVRNQEFVAEAVVQSAYSDKKLGLLQLAKFVCRIENLSVTYAVINVMFREMAKNNQLLDIAIIPLNYRVQYVASVSSFSSLSAEVKNSFSKLIAQLSPLALNITTSLVNDIAMGEFKRPKSVFEVQNNFYNEKYLFLADLVKVYLSSTNLVQFVQMYNFIEKLKSPKKTCYMYAILWQELNSRGFAGKMEALAVWVRASEISQLLRDLNRTEDAHCNSVANFSAPAYKETLTYKYENYIKNGQLRIIKELHKKYYFAFFFADYIRSLTLGDLHKKKFDKLVDAINALPIYYDTCYVVAAMYKKLKKSKMLGTSQHFQTLLIVKNLKASFYYAQLASNVVKSMCDSVNKKTHPLFKKLLFGNISKCKLLNRFYKDEPLYCDGVFHLNQIEFKKLYTGTVKSDDANRYWKFSLAANSHGVSIDNNYYSNCSVRYIFVNTGTVYGTEDLTLDYFRIHIVDDVYIQLELSSKSVYVGVSSKTCDTDKRCVEMMTDANDKKTQWKLICDT